MKASNYNAAQLQEKAQHLRAICIKLAHTGREGHLNGALSSVEILIALYHYFLNITPENIADKNRDRFIFSKGHACTSWYAILYDKGLIPKDYLPTYAQNDSPLPSHPCSHMLPVIDWSSGSLGHGLGVATGMSYGHRLDNRPSRTAVLLSDGECNEGSTWEAAMFAATHKLDRLLAIVDFNGIQSIDKTKVLIGETSFAEKFESFGWSVREVDGHNTPALIDTLAEFPFTPGKPSVIVAKTVAGKGVSFMEDQVLWHYRAPSDEDLERALAELNQLDLRW